MSDLPSPTTSASGPLKTFLRGGQVTLHTLRMFGQVMRFLALGMVTVALVIAFIGIMANTSSEERHYAMKRYEAWAYDTAGVKDDVELNMLTSEGTREAFTIDTILAHPVVAEHERTFRGKLFFWSTWGAIGGGVGFIICTGLFLQRGGSLTKTNFKRGAAMAKPNALKAEVISHNRAVMRQRKGINPTPYEIAGIPYPLASEVQHTLISGTIGAGKTQAISALLEQIRAHGDRAVVFDLTGGFIAPFYRPGHDQILNPLDARSPAWSVFSEAKSKAAFDAIAAAMIPKGRTGDPVWADSARMVFSTAGQLLLGDGKASSDALVETLLTSDLNQLAAFFIGTPAASIMSPDTPKMTNSVRMMLNTYLDCLRLLPSEGVPFSITDWITREDEGSTLFLSSRADMHETLKPLLTVWMDTAVRALMSQPRDPNRRIWFIMDEVAALQALPSIMDGLARGRQFGAAFVLGVQAQSQLRDIYGPDGAQSLSSVARTKLIMAAADADTAKWYADFLGRQETSRSNENVSFGANTIRDGVMVARQERVEHLVIPEEILNLKSLEGFLKLPEGFPLAKVNVPLVIREDSVPAFSPRGDQNLLVTRTRAPHTVAAMQAAARGKPRQKPKPDQRQSDMFAYVFPDDGTATETQPEAAPSGGPEVSETSPNDKVEKDQVRPRRRASAEFPDWDMEV